MNRYQQRADRPGFTYDNGAAPSDLTKITSVQIDLFVNPTPTLAAATSRGRSRAARVSELAHTYPDSPIIWR